jgi:hypothetical protein
VKTKINLFQARLLCGVALAAGTSLTSAATFTDANWISMGGIPGANGQVNAAVVDGSGDLYIGGAFTVVGDMVANYVAKWDGSRWTALGSGVNGNVFALAVSGSNVYAGGQFTMAGGSSATNRRDGAASSWSVTF